MLGENSSAVDALDEGAFFEIFSVTPGKGDADYGTCPSYTVGCPRNYNIPLKDFRVFNW